MKIQFTNLGWFLFFIFTLMTGACKKDDDTYEKKFRCKVNGQNWSPYSGDFKFNPVDAHSLVTTSGKRVLLVVGYNSKKSENVGFFISDLVAAGDYALTSTPNNDGFLQLNNYRFETDGINTGVVSIHSLDTVTKKVSGSFTFKAKLVGGNQTVNVTNGHFEVTYKSY